MKVIDARLTVSDQTFAITLFNALSEERKIAT
jgi:hypothetical protein